MTGTCRCRGTGPGQFRHSAIFASGRGTWHGTVLANCRPWQPCVMHVRGPSVEAPPGIPAMCFLKWIQFMTRSFSIGHNLRRPSPNQAQTANWDDHSLAAYLGLYLCERRPWPWIERH